MTTVSTGTEGTNTRRNAALTNNSNNQLNSPRLSEGALRGQRNASNGMSRCDDRVCCDPGVPVGFSVANMHIPGS